MTKSKKKPLHSKTVQGYRAVLKGAIAHCDDGASVLVDIKTAMAIEKLLDQYRGLLALYEVFEELDT